MRLSMPLLASPCSTPRLNVALRMPPPESARPTRLPSSLTPIFLSSRACTRANGIPSSAIDPPFAARPRRLRQLLGSAARRREISFSNQHPQRLAPRVDGEIDVGRRVSGGDDTAAPAFEVDAVDEH